MPLSKAKFGGPRLRALRGCRPPLPPLVSASAEEAAVAVARPGPGPKLGSPGPGFGLVAWSPGRLVW